MLWEGEWGRESQPEAFADILFIFVLRCILAESCPCLFKSRRPPVEIMSFFVPDSEVCQGTKWGAGVLWYQRPRCRWSALISASQHQLLSLPLEPHSNLYWSFYVFSLLFSVLSTLPGITLILLSSFPHLILWQELNCAFPVMIASKRVIQSLNVPANTGS